MNFNVPGHSDLIKPYNLVELMCNNAKAVKSLNYLHIP